MGRRQTACTTRSVGAVHNRTIIESLLKNQMKFLYLKQELIDNLTTQTNLSSVTEITSIRDHEGCLDLGVVMDQYPREIIDCSMGTRIIKKLVLDTLLMAESRQNPEQSVLARSD